MSSFKEYIFEAILSEKAGREVNSDLIYQKMLDVLDTAHIDFDEDRIEFHIGRIIKNSALDVNMVIRPSSSDAVRLGKNKESGEYTIVVDAGSNLPVRSEIDSFLSKDRGRALSIKKAIGSYLEQHYSDEENPSSRTGREDDSAGNNQFDGKYESLSGLLKNRINEYRDMIADLDGELETEDVGKKETIKMAKGHLTKEYFGDNVNEFKKIAKGLLGSNGDTNTGFVESSLSKENKSRLEGRLESFYDQKVKPLLKK